MLAQGAAAGDIWGDESIHHEVQCRLNNALGSNTHAVNMLHRLTGPLSNAAALPSIDEIKMAVQSLLGEASTLAA